MKPAILMVAFGAASAAAREVYGAFEAEVRQAFPGHEVRWAWTAKTLVARLRARGEAVFTLEEAVEALAREGFTSAAVLSLHVVPGEKHQEILSEDARGLQLACSEPLLVTESDIAWAARELVAACPSDRPVLVVAHGHAHEERYNAELKALGTALADLRGDLLLTRLEGDDQPEALEAFMDRARAAGKVHVVPFLLVAGDHVRNDILGDDPESLKSRLGVPDFTCGEELGRRPWIRKRFLERLGAALTTLEVR